MNNVPEKKCTRWGCNRAEYRYGLCVKHYIDEINDFDI